MTSNRTIRVASCPYCQPPYRDIAIDTANLDSVCNDLSRGSALDINERPHQWVVVFDPLRNQNWPCEHLLSLTGYCRRSRHRSGSGWNTELWLDFQWQHDLVIEASRTGSDGYAGLDFLSAVVLEDEAWEYHPQTPFQNVDLDRCVREEGPEGEGCVMHSVDGSAIFVQDPASFIEELGRCASAYHACS